MSDQVFNPSHYGMGETGVEAADIIQVVLNSPLTQHMTPYQVWSFGNALKYRLRVGGKDALEQEVAKALNYENDMFTRQVPDAAHG